ncbi:hypothetical protein CYLTODRAFT_414983 [Cylindrobasidium torrendii FP15055 ss-10]|uniref:Uncharacterized protein n=1 Tax=Cylindrobasidium torrendii FP15055 ss-10 TaxID=1314674 RepID=A0A0D7AW64_9AGAR|nr:hypothetical protein CYLTODRAFT_414983 [Cylindrobasidium torrendii FP15055 ss-10]
MLSQTELIALGGYLDSAAELYEDLKQGRIEKKKKRNNVALESHSTKRKADEDSDGNEDNDNIATKESRRPTKRQRLDAQVENIEDTHSRVIQHANKAKQAQEKLNDYLDQSIELQRETLGVVKTMATAAMSRGNQDAVGSPAPEVDASNEDM